MDEFSCTRKYSMYDYNCHFKRTSDTQLKKEEPSVNKFRLVHFLSLTSQLCCFGSFVMVFCLAHTESMSSCVSGHGVRTDGVTTFVNCAICDRLYRPSHSPYIFDLPLPEGFTKADLMATQLVPVSVLPPSVTSKESEIQDLVDETEDMHLH